MFENLISSMPLAQLLGIRIQGADKNLVEGSLQVREELCTFGATLHGGTMMAFADTLGAIAAFINLPEGAHGTTTIESKTNFLRLAPAGSTITAKVTPINIGRRLSVWTTNLMNEQDKRIAVITQTQLVL